ncbi:DMT family transporter [Marinomonas balearica]|uniref:Threonine/homoserine efflux transporter RhtA n=1 Tax=Marinomonas balearica TaxID=491947 RepID=A0A4R6M2U2_9GAMM|nr:DMT family transporter [Marinomonas balearica]TDO95577.1 threonine/homoserine efflux transporter RhtA [Marinomonas balearica]
MQILFVLLVLTWSTGFVVGKLIVGLVDPNVYLAIRFALTGLFFLVGALLFKRSFPSFSELPKHIVAGVLLNGLYLGFAYVAVAHGLPAGVMALIGAFQPVLVTLLAFLIVKEKTSVMGLIGMAVAILGLYFVISPSLHIEGHSYGIDMVLLAILAIFCLSFGSVYQKMSISKSDIVTTMAIQNLSAAAVSCVFVVALGEQLLIINTTSLLLFAWGIFVLSCGGVFLLVWLYRKVPASLVSMLMLLVPPLAAIESYFIFNEEMTPLQIVGVVTTVAGVYMSRLNIKLGWFKKELSKQAL